MFIIYITIFTHNGILGGLCVYIRTPKWNRLFIRQKSDGDIWRETKITRQLRGHDKGGVHGHDVLRCSDT